MKRPVRELSTKKQWLVASGLALLLLGLGGVVALADSQWTALQNWQSPSVTVDRTTVKVEGEVVCLPRRAAAAQQTQECALGVRDRDGYYYGVQNHKTIAVEAGEVIEVVGIYTPASDTEAYDIVGTVDVVTP